MTEPRGPIDWARQQAAEREQQPVRHTVDTITDNDLDALYAALDEARRWARHGYEIGQRTCTWADHGVAPAWLTEGWPLHFPTLDEPKEPTP